MTISKLTLSEYKPIGKTTAQLAAMALTLGVEDAGIRVFHIEDNIEKAWNGTNWVVYANLDPALIDHDALDNVHQDVNTSASPVFAGATIGNSTGIMKRSAGVIGDASAGTDYQAPLSTNPDQIATDTYAATGMLSSTDTNISFDTGTKIFSIIPTGANFSFYSSGTKYTKTVQTVDLTSIWANNTMFFVYFNTAGVLTASISVWNIISGNSPVATVFWNGTSATPILGDERHKSTRNLAWHKWAHETIGTKYKSGLDGSFSSISTTIGSGVLEDEDIVLTIPPQTDALRMMFRGPGATYVTYDDTTSATSAYIVGGALKYDNAGTITSVQSGYYTRNFIYGSNDVHLPIICIVGQYEHSNVNDARINNFPTQPTYSSSETRLLYSTIWKNEGGTPTFVEYTDYRTAPTQPNGALSTRPVFLDELADVAAPTPSTDEVLRWNGSNWVNGAPATSSASTGIDFFQSTPQIIAGAINTNNLNPLSTLTKIPTTTAEQTVVISTTSANTPVFGRAFLYNTALGRTSLDGGVWSFTTYAGVSSVANGRLSTIIRNLYQVVPGVGTLTTSGSGASRTATASTGTPFVSGDGTANITTCGYLQTPQGLYPITVGAVGADGKVATVTVPNGTPSYANENAIPAGSWQVWKRIITATTPTITAISPAYAQYEATVAYGSIPIAVTDKIGSMMFGSTSTNNATTITSTYDGTARNTHVSTPLITLHNNLAGLDGGAANEMYHLTSAQHTIATQAASGSVAGYVNTSSQTFAGTKTFSVAETTESLLGNEILTPATPASNKRKLYAKADGWYDLNSAGLETKVGTGTGGGIDDIEDVTAGDDIAEGDALYISEGAADGGRTAGYCYKLDATNSKRMGFCGLAKATVLTGATVDIKTGGKYAPSGTNTYTVGQLVYGSVSTTGRTTQTAPSTATQWVVPVGVAVSTTEILINPSLSTDAIYIDGVSALTNTGSFYISNNTAVAADVSGLAFNNTYERGGEVLVSILIDATTDLYETQKLLVVQKGASWDIAATSVGDSSGVVFSITNAGQIQYTCSNYTGFASGKLAWTRMADNTGYTIEKNNNITGIATAMAIVFGG